MESGGLSKREYGSGVEHTYVYSEKATLHGTCLALGLFHTMLWRKVKVQHHAMNLSISYHSCKTS